MERVRAEVLHTLAVHLAVSPADGRIALQSLVPHVVDALGTTLDGATRKAISSLVSQVIEQFEAGQVEEHLTQMFWLWKASDSSVVASAAANRLFALIQSELYNLAARRLWRFHDLQHHVTPSELIDELFIRLQLAKIDELWQSRGQFRAFAGKAIDNLLLDIRKASLRQKRPRSKFAVVIDSRVDAVTSPIIDEELACVEALEQLAQINPRQRDVVKMHELYGMSFEEITHELQVSESTVKRDHRQGMVNLRNILAASSTS